MHVCNVYHHLFCNGLLTLRIKYRQFNLNIRQQPEQARLSTGNERERRTIEPPPIVQISLYGVSPENEGNWLQSPNYFMCANLVHPTNDSKVYTPHHPALAGQVVSAMYKLKDIDNQDGAYCVFGDLSVKAEGEFRLKFTLFKIQDAKVINIISIISSSFMTYAAKAYPGAMEPTFLSRSFYDQGARIRIRKENSLHVSHKRKAKCEVASNRPNRYGQQSSHDSPHYLHSSPSVSPPMSHGSPTEAFSPSLFPTVTSSGSPHSSNYGARASEGWHPTIASAPVSPFPSPPLCTLKEPATACHYPRHELPILPPLRNLPHGLPPPGLLSLSEAVHHSRRLT
ncbi:hypothetical protein INT44_002174 [Umbelopsis vinacea]|uniref:Velvet domain-containing protein n=1 Tax=Umbelopsis vinacea TaxID=44442 RepID=A0A8H7Q4Z5_9FUNG|nr:hypothetical protein INT44_002174 [Umbelopsis vinacea]